MKRLNDRLLNRKDAKKNQRLRELSCTAIIIEIKWGDVERKREEKVGGGCREKERRGSKTD